DAANQIKDIKTIPLATKQQREKQRNESIIEKIKGCAAILFLGLCITSSFVGIFYLLNRLFDLNIL
ncbi:hypothetical protein, partial [Cysteiniphilum litorale]|uniref:hypothetical protein n=1 Tax=Cysteiniphilum litorale TaxID=2056700 RepID=UPI003F883F3B